MAPSLAVPGDKFLSVAPAEIGNSSGHSATRHRPATLRESRSAVVRPNGQSQHARIEELEAKLAAAERLQVELQQFVTMVAHDLRSPLLTLEGCLTLLKADLQRPALPMHADLVQFMYDGISRMRGLTGSLVQHGRGTLAELEVVHCEVKTLLAETMSDLKSTIDASGAQIELEGIGTAQADAAQLRLVFQNLIENAIKYAGPACPRITIRQVQTPCESTFCVSDNGIGIDPTQRKQVFEIFRRIPSAGAPCGHGVGLAICKKVIERHAGRIWVESEPGQGSRFYFTLPYKPPA
jgi:signal transduction histidine kinase